MKKYKRIFIFVILISIVYHSFGQTYSSIINDQEIYDFLNWMTKTEKRHGEEPFFKRKHISCIINKWDTANFISIDTGKYSHTSFDRIYLFIQRGGADTIFNPIDRTFLFQQYVAIKDSIWHEKFKNSKLLKNKKCRKPYKYYYSIPLFSFDRKYVLMNKYYYCGTECAYFGYYIYRKIDKEKWEFLNCIVCGMS